MTDSKFEIYGSYKLPKDRDGFIDQKQAKSDLRNREGFSGCGCYLFAVSAGKGIKPWYIGKAVEQSFEKECLGAHKLNIYNKLTAKRRRVPLLLLIAMMTKGGKFVKPGTALRKVIKFFETVLIGAAWKRNPDLKNIQNTTTLKRIIVPGFINTPQRPPTLPERSFKSILFQCH